MKQTIGFFQIQSANEYFLFINNQNFFKIHVSFLKKFNPSENQINTIYHALTIFYTLFNKNLSLMLSKMTIDHQSLLLTLSDHQGELIQHTGLFVYKTFPYLIRDEIERIEHK